MKKLLTATSISLLSTASAYKLTADFTHKMLYRNVVVRDDLSDLGAKSIRLKNHKGLELCGHFFEKENTKATLVMLHGLEEDASDLIEVMHYFEKMLNCNMLLLDASAHGMSDGYIRQFGYDDVFDLMLWNKYLLKRYGEKHHIIMYGKGMGANTILNTAGLNKLKNVDCIISDGAYSDVLSYLAAKAQKAIKLPSFITKPIMRTIVMNETGRDLKDMDTIKYVAKNSIPTIFIHSRHNQDVDVKNVYALYNNNTSPKELFVVREDHFYDMNLDDPYAKVLPEFLSEYIAQFASLWYSVQALVREPNPV